MKLVALQTDIAWEDPRANFARIGALIESQGGIEQDSLLVFPELATAGFSMNPAVVAEPREGESFQFFSSLARRLRCHVFAGIAGCGERNGTGANEAVCFDPGGSELGRYRKRNPFPLAREGEFYPGGNRPLVLEIGGWKVAPFICYDLRFPELFREAVALGAELLVVIANWPEARIGHWTTLLRARAIENLAFVAGVNRTGDDPHFHYPGASLVVGPKGETLAEAGAEATMLKARLDLEALRRWRREFPALDGLRTPRG